ncbi:MAG: DMT family transporter [Anaerovoracaceae bacterium]
MSKKMPTEAIRRLRGEAMLFTTALIWGSAFVAQRAGMEFIGPYTFTALRYLIGTLVLIPVVLILDSIAKKKFIASGAPEMTVSEKTAAKKILITGGLATGVVLFIATILQQVGLVGTSAGKTAFITTLYIVIVPIIGLFMGKKVRPLLWLCVLLGAAGLFLLCIKTGEGFSIQTSDLMVLLCAFGYAAHIIVVDIFAPKTDAVKMSLIQFVVVCVLAFILTFAFEFDTLSLNAIKDSWFSIFYAGAFSCGIAFTFQLVAQKDVPPTIASLLLSLESVFAVMFGAWLLGEQLTGREIWGCVIMFTAIILAQLPWAKSPEPKLDTK